MKRRIILVKNRYGHPTVEVLERLDATGSRILRTDTMGTVEMVVDTGSGEATEVNMERKMK